VERHPGGAEAILLGKGRDCTALVESYHPFSSPQVRKVLEKYRVEVDDELNESDVTDSTRQPKQVPEDFFYHILKVRVKEALLEKGIDPILDRGASTQRVLYYTCILVAWIYTGYLHLSVRSAAMGVPPLVFVRTNSCFHVFSIHRATFLDRSHSPFLGGSWVPLDTTQAILRQVEGRGSMSGVSGPCLSFAIPFYGNINTPMDIIPSPMILIMTQICTILTNSFGYTNAFGTSHSSNINQTGFTSCSRTSLWCLGHAFTFLGACLRLEPYTALWIGAIRIVHPKPLE
jgi:hypothetical protein